MSTVKGIEEAIAALPQDEFCELTDCLLQKRKAQDGKLEESEGSGDLEALWRVAEQEIAAGETVALDSFTSNW